MSSKGSGWSVTERRFLAGALLAALVLRLLHWNSFSAYPWFDFLGLDAKYYDEWAQRILRDGLQGEEPYFMGPLYPHLLALGYKIAGRSLDFVRGVQVAISVVTVGTIHLLGRRFGGPALACVSSGIAAIYGPFVYYSVSILYPTLTIFLATSLLLCLLEAARRRSLVWTFAAGALLGLYALGRGNILLFAPAAFFWLIVAWGKPFAPRPREWRRGLTAGLVLTAATVLMILPATIHNVRAGDPTLLTTNGGLNFYIGNGPMASGGHQTPVLYLEQPDGTTRRIEADLHKDVECRAEAELALGRSLSYTEVSSFWFAETMRYLRSEPGAFFAKLLMKASHFWSTYEIPQIEHFGYFRQFSLPLRGPALTFGIVGPLAVVGMLLGLARPGRWALLYLFVIFYSTSIILFFVLARYRLPILPALIPFAGLTALQVWNAWRERRWAVALGAPAGALVFAYLMQANFYGVDEPKGIAQVLYRHGIVEDARGNYEAAVGHYRDSLKLKPDYDRCHLNLGVNLARLGRREEAMQHLTTAERLSPDYYRPPFNRGLLLEELGRYEEASAAYARAVELEPRYLVARTALAEMKILSGDLTGARELFRSVVDYDGRWEGEQNPQARARAGRYLAYLAERARWEKAGFGECFRSSPGFRLAELSRLRGRREEALARLRNMVEDPPCPEARVALGRLLLTGQQPEAAAEALEGALAATPEIPGAHLGLARIAAARGDGGEALRHLREEMRADPGNPTPHLETGLVLERLLAEPERAKDAFDRYLELGGDREVLRRFRDSSPASAPGGGS